MVDKTEDKHYYPESILFIYSGYFYSVPSSPLLLTGASDYSIDYVSEFHAEAPQATVSERLAQSLSMYVADRARFEPTTLQSKGIDSTNAPPRPTLIDLFDLFDLID